MTYFQDLTPYQYSPTQPGKAQALNIGWLSSRFSYEQGDTPEEFRGKLFRLCQDDKVVNIMRGFHVCELCFPGETIDVYDRWHRQMHNRYGEHGRWMALGSGEIRVMGDGVVYAAPVLIYHYVVDHHYRPPEEFVRAVVSG